MSSSNAKTMGLLALIAVVLFLAVIAFQFMELMHYRAD